MKSSREWLFVLACLIAASALLRLLSLSDRGGGAAEDAGSRLAIHFRWDEEMFETAGHLYHYSFELMPLEDGSATGGASRYQAELWRGDRVVKLEGTLRGNALAAFVTSVEGAGAWSIADASSSLVTLCGAPPWYRFSVRSSGAAGRQHSAFFSRPDDSPTLKYIDAIHGSLVGRLRTELLRQRATGSP